VSPQTDDDMARARKSGGGKSPTPASTPRSKTRIPIKSKPPHHHGKKPGKKMQVPSRSPAAAQAWSGGGSSKKEAPKKKRHSGGGGAAAVRTKTGPPSKEFKPKKKTLASKHKAPSYAKQPPLVLRQLSFPSPHTGPVPWLCEDVIVDRPAPPPVSSPAKQHKKRLPTDASDPVGLARLSEELVALASYVRLTTAECEARDALLEHMHSIAGKVFGNDPAISRDDLELQVFGSYACRAVCSFQSDIDVALWGAVYSKETTVQRKRQKEQEAKQQRQQQSQSTNQKEPTQRVEKQVSRTSATPGVATVAVPTEKVLAKALKVEKWKAALAALDDDNMITPDHSQVTAPSSDEAQHKNAGSHPVEQVEESNLFVLDRTGWLDGEDDKQTVATATTVTESEVSTVAKDDEDSPLEEDVNLSDDDTADKLTEGNSLTVRFDDKHGTPPEDVKANILPATAWSDSESDGMEVHLFHQELTTEASDFSRRKVVDGLERYFRGLRKSGMPTSIQLISRA
jgi:hypothetical protein